MPKPVIVEEHFNTAAEISVNSKWWKADDKSIFQHVIPLVQKIDESQSYRHSQNLKFAKLYANREMRGFGAGAYARPNVLDGLTQSRPTLNVVKSCTDTVSSKIAKNKPRPLFLTVDGDYSLQRKAKLLTQYVDGLFDSADVYEVGKRVFVHACIFGTGALKIYVENGSIKCERVFIDEIIVDDAEGVYGEPQQLHQKKLVFRDKLLDLFPEHAYEIKSATNGIKNDSSSAAADQVLVTESWHLPSGPDAGDGKHTICIDSATLFAEEYTKPYFPFVFFRWCNSEPFGFWGTGLAEELVGIQFEINKLLKNIQTAMGLMAVPRVFIENSSMVNSAHINNEIGGIVKYTGTKPEFGTAPVMSPEVYQHLENLYKKAYEITGISLLSAASRKPGGLDSAVALREYQEIETERFAMATLRYESFFLDVAKVMIDMSRDLYAGNRGLSVKAKGAKFIQQIKWKQVDLEDDKFSMQVFPTNMLPRDPAGRLQTAQELIAAGFVEKEFALSLLDFPDTEGFTSLQTAALDNARMVIEKIVEDEIYTPPEPYMNLELCQKLAHASYLKLSGLEGVSEVSLEMLRTFIDDCGDLLNPEPTTPPPPDMTGQPIAQGEAQPTSQLMPTQGAPVQ